jgi:hypothetical protein
VASGATPDEVARALGFDTPPANGPLHIAAGPRGAFVHSDAGNVAIFLWDLAEALPGRRIHLLVTGPDPGRFLCRVVQDESDIGAFETPWPEHAQSERLDAIEGETEPAAIAAALGVPRALLGLG